MTRLYPAPISVLVPLLLLMTGCATSTPYQKATEDGGYGYRVSPHITRANTYVAIFNANCDTTTKQAEAYVIRTVKEFCENLSGLQYRLVAEKDISRDSSGDQSPVDTSDCTIEYHPHEVTQCDAMQPNAFTGAVGCVHYSTWTAVDTIREGQVKASVAFECIEKVK